MARIAFVIDDELKEQLKELLDYCGMDMTSFYVMMTRQTVQSQMISFDIKKDPIMSEKDSSNKKDQVETHEKEPEMIQQKKLSEFFKKNT